MFAADAAAALVSRSVKGEVETPGDEWRCQARQTQVQRPAVRCVQLMARYHGRGGRRDATPTADRPASSTGG